MGRRGRLVFRDRLLPLFADHEARAAGLGRPGGRTNISLSSDCIWTALVAHDAEFWSRRTCRGSLSGRSPRQDGWRRRPSAVHSVKATSPTRRGLDPGRRASRLAAARPAKGTASRAAAPAAPRGRSSIRSVNPVPTPPTCSSPPAPGRRGSASRSRPRAGPGPGASRRSRPPASAVLDLAPVRRPPPRQVRRGAALGHDALEPVLAAGRQDVRAAARGSWAAPATVVASSSRRSSAARRSVYGSLEQRAAVQAEQVEDEVDDRHPLGEAAGRGRVRGRACAPAAARSSAGHARRTSPARRRGRAHARRPAPAGVEHLGIAGLTSRSLRDISRAPCRPGVGDRADAVPLHLVRPRGVVAGGGSSPGTASIGRTRSGSPGRVGSRWLITASCDRRPCIADHASPVRCTGLELMFDTAHDEGMGDSVMSQDIGDGSASGHR